MINIEIQYFNECPNSQKMIDSVNKAIDRMNADVECKHTLVETEQEAVRVKFRGSPTLLINDVDFENLPERDKGTLSCRYYANGIPTDDQIVSYLKSNGLFDE